MSSITLTSTLLLPMLVIWMLMIVNIFERRLSLDKTSGPKKIFNLRDIFLATLILDLVAISSTVNFIITNDHNPSNDIIIPFVLFILHLSFLIINPSVVRRYQNAPNDVSKIKSSSLFLEMYLGAIILFTNALTIRGLLVNI